MFNFLNSSMFEELRKRNVLVIDIGKHTTDMSYVSSFTLVKGVSVDIGVSKLIGLLRMDLNKFVQASDEDIELMIKEPNRFISNFQGDKISLNSLSNRGFYYKFSMSVYIYCCLRFY